MTLYGPKESTDENLLSQINRIELLPDEGAHTTQSQPSVYAHRIIFLAHFNAGVRRSTSAIRSSRRRSRISAHRTDKATQRCVRVNNVDRCKTVIQTNNLEADNRGHIYAVDRANIGLHIPEWAARRVTWLRFRKRVTLRRSMPSCVERRSPPVLLRLTGSSLLGEMPQSIAHQPQSRGPEWRRSGLSPRS